jgi:hypothetical protein
MRLWNIQGLKTVTLATMPNMSMPLAAVSSLGRFRNTRGVERKPLPNVGCRYAYVKVKGHNFTLSNLANVAFNRHTWTPDKRLTEHLNGDKTDNRSINLTFGSIKTNNIASVKAGKASPGPQRNVPLLAFAPDDPTSIIRFKSGRQAANTLGVSPSSVANALRGKSKTSGGYVLKYNPPPDLKGEIWKELPGFPSYRVSSMNRIESPNGRRIIPNAETNGYRKVSINGKLYSFHVLVALVFCHNDDPDNKVEVDHLNFDPLDCRPENLEWVTHAENMRRSHANNKKRRSGAPNISRPVKARRLDGTFVGEYKSTQEASRQLNLNTGGINVSATKGRRCKEYRFEWAGQMEEIHGEVWVYLTDEILEFTLTKTHGATMRKCNQGKSLM